LGRRQSYSRRVVHRLPHPLNQALRFTAANLIQGQRLRLLPENCFAHYMGAKCEIWAPTQVPQDVRDSVATAVGLKPDDVHVNVTLLGGGFGRRLEHDYAVEAAVVSKAINAPVKVMWTREDDMRFSTYRPPSIHRLSAVVDAKGAPVALTHRLIAPTISGQKGMPVDGGIDPDLKDEAAFLYPVPNLSVEYIAPPCAVPLAWLRSVYAAQVAFANESFLDELAHQAGKDPYQYRRSLLGKHPRTLKVLETAAQKAGWGSAMPNDVGLGVASSFGQERDMPTWCACVARVRVDRTNGQIIVEKLTLVVDAGTIIQPDGAAAQVEGSALWGLSMALYEGTEFVMGQPKDTNLDTYSLLRMGNVPEVEVEFMPSTEAPVGLGEPATAVIAPAIANAIFASTGARLRHLPIRPADVRQALTRRT